ncbi:hypothetical protein AB6C66_07265 [Vibrio splendidus]|uniref:hypothetical protein n=1 Tax=Vibrio splendidus TaxID=29497 RepID=UPI00030C1475|nr:hypothetical protein [Vibrio splendidus]OEF68405.1 hypothetical protein A148_05705 [Vibrio splendidus 1F-157]PTP72599.1 hypothetical protein CWO23_07640 [Vibrio splendidus]
MSLEQQIASLVDASNNLTGAVNEKVGEIDERVSSAEQQFNAWKANFSESVNGVEVYKQGSLRQYFFRSGLNNGGYISNDGPNSSFPRCSNPQSPYYVNLLEFSPEGGSFGSAGDFFKIEYIQTHRGMGSSESYLEHFKFTGSSSSDSVGGLLEVVATTGNGIGLFISEPNNEEKEIMITKELIGTKIPISFRSIGQGYNGFARITVKVDSRYHCGAGRAFGADVTYTSNKGRPPANRVSQHKPKWDVV